MNEPVLKPAMSKTSIDGLARLSQPLGYRFSGDIVHLQARFTVLDPAAHQCSWVLQLWACPAAPSSVSDLAGHIVAEVALPPMREAADDTEHLDMSALAWPPAGNSEHFMVLALAAGEPGNCSQVHDISTFPRLERFIQPRMRGRVAYRIDGNRVYLSVDHIENPRDAANSSGTLALELWALAEPYKGRTFRGVPLGGVVIGTLAGQTESRATSFELPFSPPPAGKWYFVMMLCEWTAAGYVTRDFTNFSNPVVYAPPVPITPATINALVPAAKLALTVPSNVVAATTTAKSRPNTASAGATASSAKHEAPRVVDPKSVSINTSAAEELAAVDGISPKLAQAIIEKRPFSSLDELRRIRGITVKLLNKIRAHLRL